MWNIFKKKEKKTHISNKVHLSLYGFGEMKKQYKNNIVTNYLNDDLYEFWICCPTLDKFGQEIKQLCLEAIYDVKKETLEFSDYIKGYIDEKYFKEDDEYFEKIVDERKKDITKRILNYEIS